MSQSVQMSPVVEIDELPEQFLDRFQVPVRLVENALAGRGPRLVHPLAARRALGDDPGPLKASVPSVMQTVDAPGIGYIGRCSRRAR
jgi:hypothetical protein